MQILGAIQSFNIPSLKYEVEPTGENELSCFKNHISSKVLEVRKKVCC